MSSAHVEASQKAEMNVDESSAGCATCVRRPVECALKIKPCDQAKSSNAAPTPLPFPRKNGEVIMTGTRARAARRCDAAGRACRKKADHVGARRSERAGASGQQQEEGE
eukprot:scaffold213044_cov31-Tisochrysis_lutea.AAC.3